MHRAQRGFTLIELLVVIVIIGSLVSLTVLAGGDRSQSRELRDEAERLAGLVALLSDEAVMNGEEYGLQIEADSYGVLRYDHATDLWQPLEDRPRHRLPVWLRLELELDGEPLALPVAEKETKDEADFSAEPDSQPEPPQVLILSSGELSPFSVRLQRRNERASGYVLSSDGYQLPQASLVTLP